MVQGLGAIMTGLWKSLGKHPRKNLATPFGSPNCFGLSPEPCVALHELKLGLVFRFQGLGVGFRL